MYCLVGERLLLVSTSDATRSKKEASQAAARSLVIWSAKIQRALERHQVTPSDRSSGSEEMEGKSISRGSRNRKQAGWLLKSMSSNRRGRTAKKPRTQTTRKRESFLKTSSAKKQLPADQSPSSFEGRRIAKRFDEGLFFGTIVSHRVDKRTTYWHVQYDDDDAEDLDYDEVLQQTALFESYSEQSLSDAISISDGK